MIVPEERIINGVLFRRVCRSVDVVERKGMRITLSLEHDVALFRVKGSVRAISNVCPHKQEPRLCEGLVRNGTVECPLHGWTYDITTGAVIVGSSSLKTYTVRELNNEVWLEVPPEVPPKWASW